MKNQFGHVLFFSLVALLLTTASVLTYSQWVSDTTKAMSVAEYQANHIDEVESTVIDTTRFYQDPCYNYVTTDDPNDCNSKTAHLTKTVLTVAQDGQDIHNLTSEDLKRMPPNTSLNMMLDAYTVSRTEKNGGTSYFVTVESFDAVLRKVDNAPVMLKETGEVYESFNAAELGEMLDITCAAERLKALREQANRLL